MSIVTSRADPPPLHNAYGSLQPSAMPRPNGSPDTTAGPYALPQTKDDKPSAGGDGMASTSRGGRLFDATLGKRGAPDGRTVLGRVNVNAAAGTSASAASLHKRVLGRTAVPPPLPSKMIPRPSAVPDVFAPDPTPSAAAARATSGNIALGKRARDLAPTTGTTAAPSKRSRAEARAEAAAIAAKNHKDEQKLWLGKWQKVFPTLVFHFEIGAEEGAAGRGLRARVLNMGARIDQFFSQRVSHLIVKGSGSPQKARAPLLPKRRAGRGSDNPFLDHTGVTDLVQKAEKLGVKVWTVKKLMDMLDKLAPIDTGVRDSLSNLLADEKLHGTRERDFSAPRPDYYYFKPGNKYLLVEDATGRHRPIMVKEYGAKDQEWPVVHEHFLRLSSSSQMPASIKSSRNLVKDLRERAWALYVDNVPYRGEEPPVPSIKRSSSLRDIPVAATPVPDAVPYANASGNSVVITSNIASTSTNNATPGAFAGGIPQLGANKDRAIMQMSKRVQVLKGNARLAAGRRSLGTCLEDREPATTPAMGVMRRRSTGMDCAPAPAKEFSTQAQVVAMLRSLKAPTKETKPSYEERVRNREQVDAGYKRKEQDTGSGYCENCRVRYTDLSVHIASRKHRRFAQNPANFNDLDDMLHCLQRPPNPLMCLPTRVCRPCNKSHGRDAACGRCLDDPDLYSSPPPSSQPGSARKLHPTHQGAYDDGADEESEDEMERDELDEGSEVVEEAAEPADWDAGSEA